MAAMFEMIAKQAIMRKILQWRSQEWIYWDLNILNSTEYYQVGGLAQMVERSLSMREVPGSMPGSSTNLFIFLSFCFFLLTQLGILIYKRLH